MIWCVVNVFRIALARKTRRPDWKCWPARREERKRSRAALHQVPELEVLAETHLPQQVASQEAVAPNSASRPEGASLAVWVADLEEALASHPQTPTTSSLLYSVRAANMLLLAPVKHGLTEMEHLGGLGGMGAGGMPKGSRGGMPNMGGSSFPGFGSGMDLDSDEDDMSGFPGGFGGGGGARPRARSSQAPKDEPPSELVKPLPLSLEDIYTGATRKMRIRRKKLDGTEEPKTIEVHVTKGEQVFPAIQSTTRMLTQTALCRPHRLESGHKDSLQAGRPRRTQGRQSSQPNTGLRPRRKAARSIQAIRRRSRLHA